MGRSMLLLVIALACSFLTLEIHAQDNHVYERLVSEGVYFNDDVRLRLPEPTMADGLDREQQLAGIEAVARPRYSVQQLMRPSVVAPFVLEIRKIDVAGWGPARGVDVYFVAHGELELLYDEDFLQDLARESEARSPSQLPTEVVFLEANELSERTLRIDEKMAGREVWFHSRFSLFDRVYLRVTRHAVVTTGDESVLVAARLDERFLGDAKYPNGWWPLARNNLGDLTFGEAHDYASAGFYLKATELIEPEGAIFIEYHQVFDEREEWFSGANLLRSKLPLLVQDGVRKFRSRLTRASEALARKPQADEAAGR